MSQMQEYERARRQIELMRDIQHQEALAEASDRSRMLGVGSPYPGMDAGARSHQIAEYLAGQRSRAVEENAEAWRSSNHTAARADSPPTNESDLKMEKANGSPGASSKKRKHSDSADGMDKSDKKKAASPKRSGSPKKAMDKGSSPAKTNGSDNTANAMNGEKADEAVYPPPAKPDAETLPEKSETAKEPVTIIAPVEKHASKTLAHLKAIQENHKESPAKTTKKRKKTPVKKMDSLASLPDKSSSGGKKKKPAAKPKAPPRLVVNASILKRNPGVPTLDDPQPPITDTQYECVDRLMEEFCRVPFLLEFSRPVSLLHPEVSVVVVFLLHC